MEKETKNYSHQEGKKKRQNIRYRQRQENELSPNPTTRWTNSTGLASIDGISRRSSTSLSRVPPGCAGEGRRREKIGSTSELVEDRRYDDRVFSSMDQEDDKGSPSQLGGSSLGPCTMPMATSCLLAKGYGDLTPGSFVQPLVSTSKTSRSPNGWAQCQKDDSSRNLPSYR